VKTNGKPNAPNGSRTPLRVLVADDSPATIEGLSSALAHEDDIQVAGSATKAIEALSLIDTAKPDVVLLNIHMTGHTLLSMLHLVKRATPVPTVIVLTPYPLEVLRERCLDSGADYVFPKPIDFQRVTNVLKKLAAAKKSGLGKSGLGKN
jgi:DNA-binding NarL/FixJ family response regulator